MTTDDRLNRHLARQASAINLPPADPAEVKRRGSRRRSRRRGALAASASVLALALVGTTVARLDDDPERSVEAGVAAAVVDSPFDWTVIDPQGGLGYSRRPEVQLGDGTLYGLSTAPGAFDAVDQDGRTHLYRSADGAEWVEVALPEDLAASSLAASGDTLYAIGTAPATGGGRDLVVAASRDGAASWAQLELPDEVAALEARHPGQISISQPTIASKDGTNVVASVVVSAHPDFERIPGWGGDISWEYTDEGIVTEPAGGCEDAVVRRDGSPECPPTTAASTTTVVGPDGEVTSDTVRQAGGPTSAARESYTWEELGVGPELRDLIDGRTYVYASDGGPFEPVELPGGSVGLGSHVVATGDGYRLVLAEHADGRSAARILRSTDGRSWQPAGELPGSPQAAGLVGGRPAVALYGAEGGLSVRIEQADGTWSPLDLTAPVAEEADAYDVAFGPLGLAAVVGTRADDVSDVELHLVHSRDGSTLSAVSIDDLVGEDRGAAVGLAVSADAITVRLSGPNDRDPATVPDQRVLVGTPAG